uniref:Ankyrin repeats-like n=1 Tax=Phallusia mammillata TaxID=59560 RepID=A0A6F9DX21_9ASCI|nr:ankyrin repeats-like [Phallusia mammillata]
MVLIMFVRNVPTFGIYVLMLNHVLRTFVEFFVVFVLFILGFAFSFHCLLQNQYAFREWWNAVIKTSLMMIGEFQFEAVFVAEVAAIETAASDHTITVSTVNYRAVSYILFVIFLIIMSIIIMNLLVGLAVDDIKGVQKNAELEYLAMKVKLTLDVEYSLPQFIRRRLKRQYCWFYPDKYRKRSAFIQWLFSVDNLNRSTINKALNPEKNKQEILEKRVNSIDQNVDSLDQKVESMNQKYESLDKKVDSLEQKVESMNQKVESVDQKVESLNQKVESMDQKYESMNQKVESVDQKVGSVDQKIESMNQKVYSMDQNVESVKEMITAILSHFKICEDKVVKEDDINS